MWFIYLLKIKDIISVDKVALPKAYVIHLFVKAIKLSLLGIKDIISVDKVALPKAYVIHLFIKD